MTILRLVAEGVTDWHILNAVAPIVSEGLEVERLHPQEVSDNTSRDGDEPGWVGVLRYIESAKFAEVISDLAEDEYVVVQIDSDIAREKYFGVDLSSPEGVPLTCEVLLQRVCENLSGRCGKVNPALLKKRVIFAVCVDSSECWLLPFFFTPPVSQKTSGCIRKLNEVLTHKHGLPGIDPSNKDHSIYRAIAHYARKKRKKDFSAGNASLDAFIEAARQTLEGTR